MSLRLGEILIQSGVIDEAQLERALAVQSISGGHLGTCLVEQGSIDVDLLAKVLGEQFRINPADRSVFDDIDSRVIAILPRKLVEKHEVIPFELKNRHLHVAMLNPGNLLALDELSFATGCWIENWVAPEILIVQAMERYYEVQGKLRYIALSTSPELNQPDPKVPPTLVPKVKEILKDLRQRGQQATEEAAAKRDQEEADDLFTPQTLPKVVKAAASQEDDRSSLSLQWMKPKQDGEARWCDLFTVPLEHSHFNGMEGVYVIWHHGLNPVLRVGQGCIREELASERHSQDLLDLHADEPVFVTWARVSQEDREGVQRYLAETLNPQVIVHVPDADPVTVNLPL